MYKTLRDAVDVLTRWVVVENNTMTFVTRSTNRSSLGFMYQQPEDEIEAGSKEILAALQLESLSKEEDELSEELDEVEQELRQELHILQKQLGGEGEIQIRFPEDLLEKQRFEALVEDQEDFPLQSLLSQSPRVGPSFEHFPVQNIFDSESIERLLDGMSDQESSEDVALIEKEQLDDLLLANYLKNSFPNSETESEKFLKGVMEEERESRSLSSVESSNTNSLDGQRPTKKEEDELVLVAYNSTVYVPLDRIETIDVGDTTEKNSKEIQDR